MSELQISSPLVAEKDWFLKKYLSELEHPLKESLKTVLLASDYACRHIHILMDLIKNNLQLTLYSRNNYFKQVRSISLNNSQHVFMKELRRFRNEHYLRLLLLQAGHLITTEEVLASWSDCADALILHAIAYCQQDASIRYGMPRTLKGEPSYLFTLAMGKLGGGELNFSSDIDLIFTFSEHGETDGAEVLTNQQFYSKVIQNFVAVMQTVTADGFVFRVDLRLRPNGESGPLLLSLSGMETYYQEQGRDWERYAMVKARVISADLAMKHSWFGQLITPFVYRRYVDFSVIESLRSMKAMIDREVQLNPRLDDIKRGQGGIREIEFIIQNFQLIRGGRIPQLQTQSVLNALEVLKQERMLPRCNALKHAYLFLRRLENAIQSISDQQTHSLPHDDIKKEQIAVSMEYASWKELLTQLQQYQRIISHSFRSVLVKVDADENDDRLLANQLMSLWQGHIEQDMAVNLLTSLGFVNAERCYQLIHAFRHSARCRRLVQTSRMRLDRFMVIVLTELCHSGGTDEVLLQVMHLLEQIVGRSAYLALLAENPNALKEMIYWFEHSPFMTSLLVNQPFLLECLLDGDKKWRPYSRRQLAELLQEQLSPHEDLEHKEELLRQFKLTYWFMAARAELYVLCSATRISQFLADLAQVILVEVLNQAFEQLSARYPEMDGLKSRFAVIAYGTFGSREMNYGSDLDLVFLHTAKPEEEALVTRLTQKILNAMMVRSQSGILYSVDTRLRPSGASGLLVSHIEAFVEYQKNRAWTWEHQALLKARIVFGTPGIRRQFIDLKKNILQSAKNREELKDEVLLMRTKIGEHLEPDPLKHDRGGLLDLEFLVQFLVLSSKNSFFVSHTYPLKQINGLLTGGYLSKEHALVLTRAYEYFHHILHQRIIKPEQARENLIKKHIHDEVALVCDAIYSSTSANKS